MRLLLDTHAFFWWFSGSSRLSPRARQAIEDEGNDVLVSAATAWEIATKHRLGKLPEAAPLAQDIAGAMTSQGFEELPITVADASRAGSLPGPLRDPFDRVLIAQSLSRDLALASNETIFENYGVRRVW